MRRAAPNVKREGDGATLDHVFVVDFVAICNCGSADTLRRSSELQAARELVESLQEELAEKQREAEEAEGRVMELCEGTESLSQELQAAKSHICRQAEEKEAMVRAAAVQAQQLAERSQALEDSEAQKNQANESLALMSARMDEMEEKVLAQEAKLSQANARCVLRAAALRR